MRPYLKAGLAACISAALSLPASAVHWTHYDQNPDFAPMTLPNGAVTELSGLAKLAQVTRAQGEVRAEKIAENIHMIYGVFYGPVVIERPNGLIVFNTGEHTEDGAQFRKIIREQISEKPIIAVLYDHSHYAKGTSTLLDGDDAVVIGHPDTNDIMAAAEGLANPNIPEMGVVLNARSDIHFSAFVPNQGPDAPAAGADLDFSKPSGFIPVNKPVTHSEEVVIDGLTIQALHEITDAQDTVTYWMPELELVVDNAMWPVYNMYTLRGDRYRSPKEWMSAILTIRDLEPEIVLNAGGGAAAYVGKQNIIDTANALHDGMAFIYDQSIRLTNKGVKPEELKHHIEMPESLKAFGVVNEGYGQWESFPEAFPLENQGWFSGYAEDLHNLPAEEKATRTVSFMGGEERVYQEFKRAFDASELLWAKDLILDLYYIAPDNEAYRQSLADTFRALGQRSPGSIVRNFYLSSARALEGDDKVTITGVESKKWIAADVKRAVNHLRVRIIPEQAAGMDQMITFDIDGKHVGLHIRNSVAEFVTNPEQHYKPSDVSIRLTTDEFVEYYQGRKAVKGLEVFDTYKHIPMYPTKR